jgi:hypothetical protein
MTGLTFTYDPRTLDRLGIERALAARVRRANRLARWALPAAALAFLALSAALSVATRDGKATALWLFPCLAFFLTHDLIQRAARRRYLASRQTAPIRNRASTTLRLDATGITADGARIAWAEVIEVLHLKGATVLLVLPDSGLPIPDAALPPGLSPEALAARITDWKSA